MLAVDGSVSRVTVCPLTWNVTDALPVTTPAVGLLNVTVHWPLTVPVPLCWHVSLLTVLEAPFESSRATVTWVPSGALTKPLPSPLFCLTVTVKVWSTFTSFVAVGGAMAMLASTNVFVAGPEPRGPAPTLTVVGLVSRVTEMPPTSNVTAAFAVTLPALGDENVTVHWPLTVPVVQVLALMELDAPRESAKVTVG